MAKFFVYFEEPRWDQKLCLRIQRHIFTTLLENVNFLSAHFSSSFGSHFLLFWLKLSPHNTAAGRLHISVQRGGNMSGQKWLLCCRLAYGGKFSKINSSGNKASFELTSCLWCIFPLCNFHFLRKSQKCKKWRKSFFYFFLPNVYTVNES